MNFGLGVVGFSYGYKLDSLNAKNYVKFLSRSEGNCRIEINDEKNIIYVQLSGMFPT